MGFSEEQLRRVAPLWKKMLDHRFLRETRDGTIARETFIRWMRQDYLFVEAAVPFVGALMAKALPLHREPLTQTLIALHAELKLFEERAAAIGVELRGAPPAFVNHAYIQFLMASALQKRYAEGYTVFYAAEKAYHDSWKVVKAGIDPKSEWMPFVENWAGQPFGDYVRYLGEQLDMLAERESEKVRAAMSDLFETTVKYEIAFWEMAVTGETWPGV
jgi:thiaminase/transcriptional activator TenA